MSDVTVIVRPNVTNVIKVGGTPGPSGTPGDSAYAVAVANGFSGNQAAWLASLVGAQGAQGPAGAQGVQGPAGTNGVIGSNGVDGRTILSGSGAPSSGLGANGDFYIDTAASSIYGPKASGAWGSPTSLIGATGATGNVGATGSTGAAGSNGTNGTNGTNGSNGTDGKTVRSGSGVPSNALGVDGDFYINTAALTIYGPKTAGAWGFSTSLVGPTGSTGAAGSNGTNGTNGQGLTFRGAWAPSTSYVAYDIVTNDGSVYEADHSFTSAASFNPANWNLWAQKGDTGATGATTYLGILGGSGASQTFPTGTDVLGGGAA